MPAPTKSPTSSERWPGWRPTARRNRAAATLIHNDFKFDNLVLDPADLTRVVAVLDWEMATLGDPLMDLGTTLAYWTEPNDPAPLHKFIVGPTTQPGALSRRELVERYGAITGRDISNMLFCYVCGLFKVAVIAQQIYARYVRGLTQDPRFATFNRSWPPSAWRGPGNRCQRVMTNKEPNRHQRSVSRSGRSASMAARLHRDPAAGRASGSLTTVDDRPARTERRDGTND